MQGLAVNDFQNLLYLLRATLAANALPAFHAIWRKLKVLRESEPIQTLLLKVMIESGFVCFGCTGSWEIDTSLTYARLFVRARCEALATSVIASRPSVLVNYLLPGLAVARLLSLCCLACLCPLLVAVGPQEDE